MNEQYGTTLDWSKIEKGTHPPLGSAEIHLWWLPLTLNTSQQKIALTLLSDIQRDRYYRRKTSERRLSYLAGRYYLLNLLSGYTKKPANEILLSYSQLNKPYLSDKRCDIQFNFTDTDIYNSTNNENITARSYGLFAFCKQYAIGVDIESLDRSANFAAISADRFTNSEQEYVTDGNGEINSQRCLAIWTRKEAYGKAIGKGINFKMNAVDLSSPNGFELDFSSHDDNWRLKQIQLSENVISCVTHQGHQSLDIRAFKSANHLP